MIPRIKSKFRQEWEIIQQIKYGPVAILLPLIFIFSRLFLLLFVGLPLWLNLILHILINILHLVLGFTIIRYARIKGRSPWLILVYPLSLLIIFFMKPKPEKSTPNIQNLERRDVILILFLSFFLKYVIDMASGTVISAENYIGGLNFIEALLALFSLLGLYIIPLFSLIKNRRLIVPISGFLIVIFNLIYVFFIHKGPNPGVFWSQMRFAFLAFLIQYGVLHLIVNSIFRIKDKSRVVLTPRGVFVFYALTYFMATNSFHRIVNSLLFSR